jgi:hypothetical protein
MTKAIQIMVKATQITENKDVIRRGIFYRMFGGTGLICVLAATMIYGK